MQRCPQEAGHQLVSRGSEHVRLTQEGGWTGGLANQIYLSYPLLPPYRSAILGLHNALDHLIQPSS